MAEAKKRRLKLWVKVVIGLGACILLFFLVENGLKNQKVNALHIKIQQAGNFPFINENEVKRLLTGNQNLSLVGTSFGEISIKNLEARVKANLFVDDCEIARNYKGDLFIEVKQVRPIARFFRQGRPDFYVDSTGKIITESKQYTARTVLVIKEDDRQVPDFEKRDKGLLHILNKIDKDPFFKAQISEIYIDKNNELTMFVLAGNHKILFGQYRDWENKFKKIMLFYKKIIPLKGWKAYKTINVKFDNQIICE